MGGLPTKLRLPWRSVCNKKKDASATGFTNYTRFDSRRPARSISMCFGTLNGVFQVHERFSGTARTRYLYWETYKALTFVEQRWFCYLFETNVRPFNFFASFIWNSNNKEGSNKNGINKLTYILHKFIETTSKLTKFPQRLSSCVACHMRAMRVSERKKKHDSYEKWVTYLCPNKRTNYFQPPQYSKIIHKLKSHLKKNRKSNETISYLNMKWRR